MLDYYFEVFAISGYRSSENSGYLYYGFQLFQGFDFLEVFPLSVNSGRRLCFCV